jgi:hypothetical protein
MRWDNYYSPMITMSKDYSAIRMRSSDGPLGFDSRDISCRSTQYGLQESDSRDDLVHGLRHDNVSITSIPWLIVDHH